MLTAQIARPREDLRDHTRPAVLEAAKRVCASAETTGIPCSICVRVISETIRIFLQRMPKGAFEIDHIDDAVRIAGSDA